MGAIARWTVWAPCCLALMASAQRSALEVQAYPEDLREDVEVVRRSVHLLHPDPYRFVGREALDQAFDSLSRTITVPMTMPEFVASLNKVVGRVGDAHLRSLPPVALEELLRTDVPLLPVKVRVVDDALYVEEELMGFRSIAPGSRVLRLNGVDAGRMVQELADEVPVDGHGRATALRTVEREFMQRYAIHYGTPVEHSLELLTPDGQRTTKVLRALRGEEIALSYRPYGPALKAWRSEVDLEAHAAWITLRTLDADSLEHDGVDEKRFLDLVLNEARDKELRTLVIDVRGAGGADLGMAELVFSLIAREPYRVVSAISTRQPGALPGASTPYYASVGDRSLPAGDRAVRVPEDDPRLAYTKPYDKAFQGKVYVVCDGLTRDAGAALVMLAKRSGRARIVGEEVGSNSRSFCGGKVTVVTTPRTRVRLEMPTSRFTPEGTGDGPPDHGERPHHTVSPQAWGLAKGRDTVKWSLLEMIRELQ